MGSRRQRKMRIVAYFALVATIIGTSYAVLGALLLVPLILAIPLLAGGGGLGGLFGNRRQSFLNRVAQNSANSRPTPFVPTVGESLLLAYIQSASDLYGPMLQG